MLLEADSPGPTQRPFHPGEGVDRQHYLLRPAELPPPPDAFVDASNVIFTRSLHDLRTAEWATVNRKQYTRIIEERKLQCLAFSNVVVRRNVSST